MSISREGPTPVGDRISAVLGKWGCSEVRGLETLVWHLCVRPHLQVTGSFRSH